MTSIIIPACNEGCVIERCLASILEEVHANELEIVVVCNGCDDDTAKRARRFGESVQVIETPIRSKIYALNLGDKYVSSFPRFYVDADIQLSTRAIRDVSALLGDDSPIVVAAPRAVVAYQDRSWMIRAFYHVWTRLPYFSENMIGSGVYAFSCKGRARFDHFPDITADDEFARLTAAFDERRASSTSTFTIHPPRTVAALLKILTRARAGKYELREKFPQLGQNDNSSPGRSLKAITFTPSMWPFAPIYLGLMYLAERRAHEKLRKRGAKIWERDDTSRQS